MTHVCYMNVTVTHCMSDSRQILLCKGCFGYKELIWTPSLDAIETQLSTSSF